MLLPTREIRDRAAWTGRRVALAAVAGALLAASLAFLCAAIWVVLRDEFGSAVASLGLAVFFAVGAGIVLLMRSSPPEPRLPSFDEQLRRARAEGRSYPPPERLEAMVDAFLFGMNLYLRLRARRRR